MSPKKSQSAPKTDLREVVKSGHPVKQAAAAAYREQREAKKKKK